MSELLDIYDENKIKTGKIIERNDNVGDKIENGEYILAVQCWIINKNKEILLTRRKLDKVYGGMWEPTSGLAQSGENSIQGIKRELKEEIGLEPDDNDLKLLKTVKERRTYRDIYIIDKDVSLTDINFTDGEVIDAKYVSAQEFENMIDNNESFEWLRWFLDDYNKS